MYIYKGDPTKLETLASFARSDYKNVDALVIPPEPASGYVSIRIEWATYDLLQMF